VEGLGFRVQASTERVAGVQGLWALLRVVVVPNWTNQFTD